MSQNDSANYFIIDTKLPYRFEHMDSYYDTDEDSPERMALYQQLVKELKEVYTRLAERLGWTIEKFVELDAKAIFEDNDGLFVVCKGHGDIFGHDQSLLRYSKEIGSDFAIGDMAKGLWQDYTNGSYCSGHLNLSWGPLDPETKAAYTDWLHKIWKLVDGDSVTDAGASEAE